MVLPTAAACPSPAPPQRRGRWLIGALVRLEWRGDRVLSADLARHDGLPGPTHRGIAAASGLAEGDNAQSCRSEMWRALFQANFDRRGAERVSATSPAAGSTLPQRATAAFRLEAAIRGGEHSRRNRRHAGNAVAPDSRGPGCHSKPSGSDPRPGAVDAEFAATGSGVARLPATSCDACDIG
jgi:hypothetical protein